MSVVWFKVLPPKFGGQKAVALFNAYLAEHAPLLCLCSRNNAYQTNTSFRIQKALPVGKRQVLNPVVWRRIYRIAKHHRATHLVLEFPYHGIAGVLCRQGLGLKLVVHAHNIEYLRFKEGGKRGWRWLYRLERWTMRNADLVLFKTEADLQTAQKTFDLEEKKLSVAPYGVEERKAYNKNDSGSIVRKRHDIGTGEKILLFAGTLDYWPNADAVVALVQKLIPLLNATTLSYKVVVCGRNRFKAFQYLKDLHNEKLVMAGEVNDIETYFKAADVFLNPVQSGGGVQTKTMDALSYHLNVVCFASKAAGIDHAEKKIFAAADGDWQRFATNVIKALSSNEPTPPAFFEAYNWRNIAANAFQKIIAC